jgi:hypothetical protein
VIIIVRTMLLALHPAGLCAEHGLVFSDNNLQRAMFLALQPAGLCAEHGLVVSEKNHQRTMLLALQPAGLCAEHGPAVECSACSIVMTNIVMTKRQVPGFVSCRCLC